MQSTPALAENATIQTILQEGEVHLVDAGTIYLYKPETTYQRDNFTIQALFVQTTTDYVQGNTTLLRRPASNTLEAKELPAHFTAGDFDNGETYLLITWNDNIEENTSYTFDFTINGESVFQKEFSITAKEKPIAEHHVNQVRQEENITLTNETKQEELRTSLKENGYSFTKKEFKELLNNAENNVEVDKVIEEDITTYTDGTKHILSTIYITIKPKGIAKEFYIIEKIPKQTAQHIDEITFSTQPIILEEDPLIMWDLEGMNETKELSYTVEGHVDATGETVVLGNFAKEGKSTFNKGILFAILLILVIAGVLIYFSKFAKK